MKMSKAESHTFRIWIAGDYADAIRACKEFCADGFCVSLTKADYVYTMGAESGVCVTIINYPRFSSTYRELEAKALSLAQFLMECLYQGSCSIEGPRNTVWLTRREGD